VEVHQNSLVDNAWSAQLIHGLVGRPNFGINPDLGNLYWTYDVPEESPEDCIRKLAPIAVYWHCKNLLRVYHPEMQRSVFLRVPLPDGEIDYRFALSAMRAAGYAGFVRQGGMGGARASPEALIGPAPRIPNDREKETVP
jgi:sugar phosphate isomerase/epimerase